MSNARLIFRAVSASAMVALCGIGHSQPAVSPAQSASTRTGWLSAGNGPTNDRAAPSETTLGPGSVAALTPIWVLNTTGEVPNTPAVEGNFIYAVDDGGSVWRLNAATGVPIWHFTVSALTGNPKSIANTSPAIGPAQIVMGDHAGAAVFALDKATGRLIWQTTVDQTPSTFIISAPLIMGNRVFVGVSSGQGSLVATRPGFTLSFRGSVAALDLATGALLWHTYTVPPGFTGGAVWGSNAAGDPVRHAIYIGTGNNYSVPPATAACQAKAPDGKALAACLPATDHIDSVMALDSGTGTIKWARRMEAADTWTVACIPSQLPPVTPCPQPSGQDFDFGSAPNLFRAKINGVIRDLVGAGQKSGVYWVLDRDTGAVVWGTQVSPGGLRGGIEWGSAVQNGRIYIAASNANYVWTSLFESKQLTNGGYWSALDAATGQIIWQTPTTSIQPMPANPPSRYTPPPPGALARAEGAVSVANGVMYGADAAGNFLALDAATGAPLWTFPSGGASIAAPAISGGRLFWGDGYGHIGPTTNKLYAFGLKAP